MGHYAAEMIDRTRKIPREAFIRDLNSKDWELFKNGSKIFRRSDQKYTGQHYIGYGFSQDTHDVDRENFISRKKRNYSKMPFWKALSARVADDFDTIDHIDRIVNRSRLEELSEICFDEGVAVVAKVANHYTPQKRCYRQQVWLKSLSGKFEIFGPFEINLLLDISER
jgi:hypothetical protein